jgi:hypothetical protein
VGAPFYDRIPHHDVDSRLASPLPCRTSLQNEPHAKAVAYVSDTRQVRLELTSGLVLLIPVEGIPELARASDAQLAACEVPGVGSGVSWPDLDVDISVFGLVLHWTLGADWRRRIRQELGREIGRSTSEAKATAARTNGKKGGRPRKTVAEVPVSGAVRRPSVNG